jgi:hypothetical protein
MNANSPWHDPVVAEIHATRERLADQYHNDLLAYSKAAEARCRALGLHMAEDQHLHTASFTTDTQKNELSSKQKTQQNHPAA